jgi:putative salt-induced outer membrane protein YdiY
LAAAPATAAAQILNTLRGFTGGEAGWSGTAEVSFSRSGGNTEVLELGAHAQLQYEWGRERWRIMGEQSYKSNRGSRTEDETTGHLRHNHRFSPLVSSLLFAQIQRNPFQRLRQRVLFGAGARLDVLRRRSWALAVGASHMTEIEEIEGAGEHDTDQRLSSFATLDGAVGETLIFQLTSFVQPLWSDFGDLRAFGLAGTKVKLAGGFSQNVALELRYDSRPPEDVETTDWEVKAGLGYTF